MKTQHNFAERQIAYNASPESGEAERKEVDMGEFQERLQAALEAKFSGSELAEMQKRGESERFRVSAALKKIGAQVPECGEAKLMFAVFESAVMEAVPLMICRYSDTQSAREYLDGPMYHLALAGIEPEWARSVLEDLGLITWTAT